MPDQAMERTLHSRASETIKRLRELDRQLSRVTSNICGAMPEVAADSPKPIEEHVHDKLDTISRILARLEDEMNRLQNTVGANNLIGAGQAKSTAAGY